MKFLSLLALLVITLSSTQLAFAEEDCLPINNGPRDQIDVVGDTTTIDTEVDTSSTR